ncbi:MAG: inorganic phosphate transporter [Desulfobacterales bacterium]
MTAELPIMIFGFMIGFYMAWNIGANDVANSMASSVGAKAITIRQAIFIAGILNIVGATFIGFAMSPIRFEMGSSTEVLE